MLLFGEAATFTSPQTGSAGRLFVTFDAPLFAALATKSRFLVSHSCLASITRR
jgi:hypothetical protein